MRRRHIDNFSLWREKMRATGKIPSTNQALERNGDLAELIGVVLGDGHLSKFPRTEELSIFSNSNNKGFVKRYTHLMEKVFGRKPANTKHGKTNCTRIRLYQKNIQSRLGVPYSPRGHRWIRVPDWILNDESFIVRYLRGLYEAEGSHCVHEKTSTYKVFFTNMNVSMLRNVYMLVKGLGFHPHRSKYDIQLSRKEEVYRFLNLIKFREY
jgi:hypothetical protein